MSNFSFNPTNNCDKKGYSHAEGWEAREILAVLTQAHKDLAMLKKGAHKVSFL